MGYISVKGITISSYPHKERDRVVIFFSDELGKIKANMRSVRSGDSKRSGLSDEFLYEKILLYQKNNWFTVTDVTLIDAFVKAKSNIDNYKVFSYIRELVILLVPFEQPDTQIFDLILDTIKMLELIDAPDTILASFILHFLKYTGFPVKLPKEVRDTYYFHPETGGFNNFKGTTVDQETVKEIIFLASTPIKNINPVDNAKIILRLLNNFIIYHADSSHFNKFLETIEKLSNI